MLGVQVVETTRAKRLSEVRVILCHAVSDALHPLIAHQDVVLPHLMTGEIKVAIVLGLASIGPAIAGSMAIGDVVVTAFLPLVPGATRIVGTCFADLTVVRRFADHVHVRRQGSTRRGPANRCLQTRSTPRPGG